MTGEKATLAVVAALAAIGVARQKGSLSGHMGPGAQYRRGFKEYMVMFDLHGDGVEVKEMILNPSHPRLHAAVDIIDMYGLPGKSYSDIAAVMESITAIRPVSDS